MDVYVYGPKMPYAMTWTLDGSSFLMKQGAYSYDIILNITD
jgi:hypothetical protein